MGMANSTLELINALGLEEPNLLGWSMGGMVATALAALHGPQVGRVVVVSGSAGGPTSTFPTANALQIVGDPNATALEQASLLFPVETPAGGWEACGCRVVKGLPWCCARRGVASLAALWPCLAAIVLGSQNHDMYAHEGFCPTVHQIGAACPVGPLPVPCIYQLFSHHVTSTAARGPTRGIAALLWHSVHAQTLKAWV